MYALFQSPNPRSIGRSDHPCNGLTRWRKYAFSKKDGDLWWFRQHLYTSFREGDTYVTVKLNGHVRTVVNPGAIVFKDPNYVFEYNKEYELCRLPEEYAFGRVYLKVVDKENEEVFSCQWFENPLIAFYSDSARPAKVLNLPNISQAVLGKKHDMICFDWRLIIFLRMFCFPPAEPIDEVRSKGGEFIFFDSIEDTTCGTLSDVTELNDSPIFGKVSIMYQNVRWCFCGKLLSNISSHYAATRWFLASVRAKIITRR